MKRRSVTLHKYFSTQETQSPVNKKRRKSACASGTASPPNEWRRASLPSLPSFTQYDPSDDLVRLGPCGIEELPTPQRLSISKTEHINNASYHNGDASPRKKRRSSSSPKPLHRTAKSMDGKRISVMVESMNQDIATASGLSKSMHETSIRCFGIPNPTAFQIAAVESVFKGKQSLIVLPTGAGKRKT